MEAGGGGGGLGTMRAVLAILQWWGFNVTVIITNKWIFQVPFLSHLAPSRLIVAGRFNCSLGSASFPQQHAHLSSYRLITPTALLSRFILVC
jgi:hypothetical protein